MLLLQQMIVLFILMMIGYAIRKKEILTVDTTKFLSWLVVHIANPALILSGSIERSVPADMKEVALCLGVAVLLMVGLMVIAAFVTPLFRVSKQGAGTYRVMMIFSNIGFMGFPVIKAVYGSDAMLYASLFLIPYNLLLYTYGIGEMSCGQEKEEKEKTEKKKTEKKKIEKKKTEKKKTEKKGIAWKKIFNVGVIASLLAMAIALLHIQVPTFVETTVSSLSGLTAPLSMIVIGASMVEINMKELFMDGKLLIFSFLKLLVIPVAGTLLLGLFIKNELLLGVCMIVLSTPVGSMTAMLAAQYGGDYELDSRGVALTTVLSVVTIPLVSMLVG